MRPLILLIAWIVAMFGAGPARGSHYCDIAFVSPELTLVKSRHVYDNDLVDHWTQEARGRLLEQYIAAQREQGKLPAIPFKIRDSSASLFFSARFPCVTRSADTLSIKTPDLSLRNLVRMIDYFGSPRWTSFCYDGPDPTKTPGLVARLEQELERRLDEAVGEPDLDFFADRKVVVHQVGELAVVYEAHEHEGLFYELAGKRLAIPVEGFAPVQIANRYVLQNKRGVLVLERGEVVLRHAFPDSEEEPSCNGTCSIWAEACPKWVNLACDSTVVLAYSLERNRFTRTRVEDYRPTCRGPAKQSALKIVSACE
jgi:hypothetical protein